MTNIILCGGSGTRLWPVSRSLMPKQFNKLFSAPTEIPSKEDPSRRSLFQLTVLRNEKICSSQLVVSNVEQYFLALDQLEELQHQKSRYLLEPIGRNTAPAIALACLALPSEEVVLVTPSDHLIKDEKAYVAVVKKAQEYALHNDMVTFGITPTFAETGFGYIEASVNGKSDIADGFNVLSFKEKPDAATAQSYLDAGNYYWNSGMFCFKAGLFLEELQKHAPEIYEASLNAYQSAKGDDVTRIGYDEMLNIPNISVDYALMEKSDKVKVIPSDMGWSDVGSFDALYAELPKDSDGNTYNEKLVAIDSHNNLVLGSQRLIATIDVDDLVIVDSGDALLISKRGSSQKVKEVVARVKEEHAELANIHLVAHRPWGTYTVLEETEGYKIKRIVVKPGKRLSLQKHYHRNEHWIVVSGTATVTVGDETKTVHPNESTYIKMGEVHRLANHGILPVILIEAQVGAYTGEDDIVRLDDDYHR